MNIPDFEDALCLLAFQGYLVHDLAHLLCRHLGINLCGGDNTFAGTTIIAIFAPT